MKEKKHVYAFYTKKESLLGVRPNSRKQVEQISGNAIKTLDLLLR